MDFDPNEHTADEVQNPEPEPVVPDEGEDGVTDLPDPEEHPEPDDPEPEAEGVRPWVVETHGLPVEAHLGKYDVQGVSNDG